MTSLIYIPHVPNLIELSEGTYIPVVCLNDVCIMECPSDFVPKALSVKAGCCGNEKNAFRIASQAEINQFNGG